MPDIDILLSEALENGFSQVGKLAVDSLEFMPEVRSMCAADLCHSYNRNWTCPPACGSLDAITAKVSGYSKGIIVQTIGTLEDDFDWESIDQTSKKHKKNFHRFNQILRKRYPHMLSMGAGACDICDECTYPGSPCRFPDLAITSMEAYGLFVSNVCTRSGVKYNNGPKTITFTSCFIIE